MSTLPPCPKCQSIYAYESGELLMCPECGHEWSASDVTAEAVSDSDGEFVVKDSNGDSVILIKNLPVKGAPKPIKAGTKVNNIKLVDSDHNIDCRIEGFGAMALKSEFVRKA